MKRLLLCFLSLLLAGVWVASCKDEDETAGGPPVIATVAPTCNISMLTKAGGTVSGNVQMTFRLSDQNNEAVDLEIFYNIGSGSPDASAASSSSITNPAPALTTPGSYSFTWDSRTDIPGAEPNVTIIGKVTNPISGLFSLCSAKVAVDNTVVVINQAPTCSISAPSGTTESGDVTVEYSTTDAEGDSIVSTIEYSTTGQFTLATPAPSYLNPTAATPPGTASYIWRSTTDEAGYQGAVTVRITVNDGKQTTCSTNFTLNNSAPPPVFACGIATPTQGMTVSRTVPINFNMTGTASGITGILEFPTRGIVAGGPWSVSQPSPGSSIYQWNTSSIGTTIPETGTLYLNLGATGTSALCSVTQITVDNTTPPSTPVAPTCIITAPTAGSPTQRGNVTINYNTFDANPGDLVDVLIEYQRSPGVFATAALSGPNPILDTTPGPGKTSTWLSATDFTAPFGPATVNIRIKVTDQGGLNSTCATNFTLENPSGPPPPPPNNPPTCNIVGPPAGGTYSGQIAVGYDANDVDGDLLTVNFDFNPGSGYRTATPVAPYTNPRSTPPTTALDYLWNSDTDLPGQTASVTFKVTVNDGQATANCTRPFTVDNQSAPAISFANDVYPIFSARGCTGCHGSAGGLTLTGGAAAVYPRIVPSRVNLGNPPASLIYAKPTGGTPHGGGSSLAGTPEAQRILDWITDGAPNN